MFASKSCRSYIREHSSYFPHLDCITHPALHLAAISSFQTPVPLAPRLDSGRIPCSSGRSHRDPVRFHLDSTLARDGISLNFYSRDRASYRTPLVDPHSAPASTAAHTRPPPRGGQVPHVLGNLDIEIQFEIVISILRSRLKSTGSILNFPPH